MMPNPSVPLVDDDGKPTSALLGVLPDLRADAAVVDESGTPTRYFSAYLAGRANLVPNAAVQLTEKDGTPTRPMTYLLMGLSS